VIASWNLRRAPLIAVMRETPTPDLTLTAAGGEPMTAKRAELLKRLAHEAYDRIAALRAKIKLQGNPPHTQ
jgi:hypothetical protein